MNNEYGVSAAHPLAAEAGVRILEEGGNAADAAIAVALALGVVEPYASGIGGGGNMLVFRSGAVEPVTYDYREIAPTHLNTEFNTGVPGVVKGMERIAKEQGRLPFEQLMQPAIELAEKGFEVNEILSRNLANTAHKKMFEISHMYPNKEPVKAGDMLIQKELAKTLKAIAENGSSYFYTGTFAEKIVETNVGLTIEDLQIYETVIRKPVHGTFRGQDVYSAPAPVAGALIIQTLQVIERLNLDKKNPNDASVMATIGNIIQSGYEIRNTYIGDPSFTSIEEKQLFEEEFMEKLTETIKNQEKPPNIEMKDVNNTTHFSVIDRDGMIVSTTNTISNFFGSGVYVAGFFLNNQMQNFSTEDGVPNFYERGKRCQSTIAPTIISEKGKPWLALGASGATRIPTLITTVLLKYFIHQRPIGDAIADKRFFANKTDFYSEEELSIEEQNVLKEMGYTYHYYPEPMFYGGVQAVALKDGKTEGAGDPRRGGVFRNEPNIVN